MNPSTGTYSDFVEVTMSSGTPGGIIYYTTDGSMPTTASEIYAFPLEFEETTVVKAFTDQAGHSSLVTTETYTIVPTPAPTLRLGGKKSFKTKKTVVKIRGTSANAEEVDYQIGDGDFRIAKGVASWSFNVRLKPGKNVIAIYGIGEFEDSDPLTVKVTLLKKK